ncbi:DUF3443 family protein [Caulobacter sp. S45]|uniref:DUF3443 family protein n=1 Tax=Caulobacter sp. S45 TaxID=1641861 RepID=UPI001C201EAC|nr:DUF3443 family protein [Caulobacter sp. S45]
MTRTLCALGALLILLTACGGHGGGSSGATAGTNTAPPPPPPLSNFTSITVDQGPAALATGPDGFIAANALFATVTICAPGTTNCQTIDHVLVDTGSVGLRLLQPVLTPAVLSALPNMTDANSFPVGECYQFVDGYAFGSVRQADFQIGGEQVANMPLEVVGDTGAFATVPASCSSGGGTNMDTVKAMGANGILGIGASITDCGSGCTGAIETGPATYFECPNPQCGATITRADSAAAPFQQVPNPVAAMSVDNNGTIISLPASPATGEATLTGTLYFGVGTQTNNGLGSATVLTATGLTGPFGSGLLTAIYNGQTLPQSFIDSGSSLYLFQDSTLPACSGKDFNGYYCPTAATPLSPTLQGQNGVTASAAFSLNNAQTLLSGSNSVLPGLGGNPATFAFADVIPSSFDFGLPFFYGRNLYTVIEGRSVGTTAGPFFAY